MDKINVTRIKSLDISKLKNTKVSVVGDSIELEPLPSDESDYEKGMRRAMQKIAASCGRVFGADVGYEDLPDLVESIVRVKKEKPTPTKFVKVEEPIFDLKAEFENGELYSSDCEGCYTQLKCKKKLYLAGYQDLIYRQVEIDWRDELDIYLDSISSLDSNFDEKVTLEFSESKFTYNISDNEFVAVCHLVASLTEKPEGV